MAWRLSSTTVYLGMYVAGRLLLFYIYNLESRRPATEPYKYSQSKGLFRSTLSAIHYIVLIMSNCFSENTHGSHARKYCQTGSLIRTLNPAVHKHLSIGLCMNVKSIDPNPLRVFEVQYVLNIHE